MTSGFLTRIRVRNYRSIGECDVRPGRLVFLCGPNGSGKSNFLDTLRFVSDALRTNLEHAFLERGGIAEVRRRSSGHPTNFTLAFDFRLPERGTGSYEFEIGAEKNGRFSVRREECRFLLRGEKTWFLNESGKVSGSLPQLQLTALPSDRLFLAVAAGLAPFRPIYDAFASLVVYNIQPERVREFQPSDPGLLLGRYGENLASVVARMGESPGYALALEFLSRIVEGVKGFHAKNSGNRRTVEFLQEVGRNSHPWRFDALGMSDGTLRALGVLLAIFQDDPPPGEGPGIRTIGIEEPEVALHPGATALLLDALKRASDGRQILVSSHSPDLLDNDRARLASALPPAL